MCEGPGVGKSLAHSGKWTKVRMGGTYQVRVESSKTSEQWNAYRMILLNPECWAKPWENIEQVNVMIRSFWLQCRDWIGEKQKTLIGPHSSHITLLQFLLFAALFKITTHTNYVLKVIYNRPAFTKRERERDSDCSGPSICKCPKRIIHFSGGYEWSPEYIPTRFSALQNNKNVKTQTKEGLGWQQRETLSTPKEFILLDLLKHSLPRMHHQDHFIRVFETLEIVT